EKSMHVVQLSDELNAIKKSIVWQLTMKFHRIIEIMLPINTKRRNLYDLGIKGGGILINKGWSTFYGSCRAFKSQKVESRNHYSIWIKENEPNEQELNQYRRMSLSFLFRPKISIVIPVWNPEENWLRLAIESVINQLYDNWELCIAEGGSENPRILQIIKEYANLDGRIKCIELSENKGISGNTNQALTLVEGEYVGFLDHDDELAPDALYEVVKLLNEQPNLDIIYSDNDKIDLDGIRKDPFFKPDWSLSFLLSTNYLFHLFICKKSLIDRVGGLRSEYDGAQDYDLILRTIELTTPNKIGHIDKILYHWRTVSTSTASGVSAKPYAYDAGKNVIENYLIRNGIEGEVIILQPGSYRIKYSLKSSPTLGLIVVTKTNNIPMINYKIKNILNDNKLFNNIYIPSDKIQGLNDEQIRYYSNSFKKICTLVQQDNINYLIVLNIDEKNLNTEQLMSVECISALIEQYSLPEVGIVGTGSPLFGHVVHNINRPSGPFFCIQSKLFTECIQESEIDYSYDNLQISLADLAVNKGYSNIFTPFCGGNLLQINKKDLYYMDLNSPKQLTKRTDSTQNNECYSNRNEKKIFQKEKQNGTPVIPLREMIAKKYIRGEGIEIGALHQPLKIPNNVSIHYVDRLSFEELRSQYPELAESYIVRPDILDDAQKLEHITDGKFDFCIANHVLEHMSDPIGALINWMRVLKPGGILYLSVLDIDNSLDTGRDLTTLEHLIADHSDSSDSKNFYHYIECAKYWNKLSDDNEIQRFAQENYEKNYSIHYHTFNRKSIHELLMYLLSQKPDLFHTLNIYENTMNGTDEYIYILEKGTYVNTCVEILENHNYKNPTKKPIIDVIVPVYNAYDDLIRCIYSLLRHQTNYRIILIDDCSSDPRIHELFTQLSSYESNQFTLLRNEENLGFVKSVNRGMQYSQQDVILLNSDTIVTKQWVEKLIACAYSDDTIGTVTPFTNNGTICSIPKFCEENTVPEGFTVDAYAEFIEKHSFLQYYEIPTAVGFCMLIKRAVLEKIGYFDDEAFGKGYGEENDYCMRAFHAGYRNVLCDNIYIYHKGEASFSEAKAALSKRNMDILSNRYPDYMPSVASFCQRNPYSNFLTFISERCKVYDIVGTKKRILYVLHNLGGGSEKHAFELIDNLADIYAFYVAQVQDATFYLTEYNNKKKITYQFPLNERIINAISPNVNYRLILTHIITTFQISLVHIHHLLGHTMDVFSVAKEFDIPVIFTAHDFFAVCPRINLLNERSNFCHETNNYKDCGVCLHKTLQVPESYINEWRNQFLMAFELCDHIIAPSKSTIDIISDYYPNINDKSIVIEHGHQKDLFNTHEKIKSISGHTSFHIAYFGVLIPHKGRGLFYSLAKDEELLNGVRWSIFGVSDVYSKSGYYSNANITVHGAYHGYSDLRTKVQKDPVDLVILPAKWPETFSYTLSEAWSMGIPVLVSTLGALKERVEANGGGWIVDVSDYEEVKKKIASIMQDSEDYYIKKAEVTNIKLKSLSDVAIEYATLYDNQIDSSKPDYLDREVISNMELSISMMSDPKSQSGNDPHTLSYRKFNELNSLFNMFLLSYRQIGLRYTIKRSLQFLYGIMIRREI
ncbi:glycosyltransferase, partial [Methanosalsum natronophilum]